MIALIMLFLIVVIVLVFTITLLQDDIALMKIKFRNALDGVNFLKELLNKKDKAIESTEALLLEKDIKIDELVYFLHIDKTHDNSDLFIYLKNAKCFLLATVELLKDHPMHEEFIEALSQIELIDYLLINFLHTETK